MLDKTVAGLLNTQINKEFYSAYLYLDFANYYKDAELNGFSNWYKVQAQEERDHAMRFMQYLQGRFGCHCEFPLQQFPAEVFIHRTEKCI